MPKVQKSTENANAWDKNLSKFVLKKDNRPPFTLSEPTTIDSLRLLVNQKHFNPKKILEIIKNTVYEESQEIGEETLIERKKMYQQTSECKTISIYYKLTTRKRNNKLTEYVEIALSSKILKDQYSQGIHKNNIQLIYNHLMSQNFIQNLTFNQFLNTPIEDVDIKYDINHNLSDYRIFLKHVINNVKNTTNNKKYNHFTKETNSGLEINKRSKSIINNKQYLKFYYKSLEIAHSKNEFFSTYLNTEHQTSIARIEATIPNEIQFLKYIRKPLNLNTLLNINQEQYQSIFTKIFTYLFKIQQTEIIMKDEKLEQSDQAKFIRRSLNMPTKNTRLESIENNYINLREDYKTWYPSNTPKAKQKRHRLNKTTKLVYDSMVKEVKNYTKLKEQMKKSLEESYKKTFRNFPLKP